MGAGQEWHRIHQAGGLGSGQWRSRKPQIGGLEAAQGNAGDLGQVGLLRTATKCEDTWAESLGRSGRRSTLKAEPLWRSGRRPAVKVKPLWRLDWRSAV